ncbi:hypothetical protein HPP92_029033 [Vanilla planifolia]|uniref:Uncharacterized protein n=1 Tax=Vanilla planifolia TaxID=51239 RepID=A0A835P6Y2_VANPL|nr:hypothetical protein HPP92_029033 [Vanilla planifolia]KAG0446050.1 hypothetical protein HPP92_029021 [Vanilla planifolia]
MIDRLYPAVKEMKDKRWMSIVSGAGWYGSADSAGLQSPRKARVSFRAYHGGPGWGINEMAAQRKAIGSDVVHAAEPLLVTENCLAGVLLPGRSESKYSASVNVQQKVPAVTLNCSGMGWAAEWRVYHLKEIRE